MNDPYNFVLLADLLYKKGDQPHAAERYLDAVSAYERASLFKNAIAVCKKMLRLSLSQGPVLKHLAELHALDGLASEASIYFAQYGETMVRANNPREAAAAFRKAFDNGQENPRLLEQLAEVLSVEDHDVKAAETLREAAGFWRTRGAPVDALRCEDRARKLDPAGSPALAEDLDGFFFIADRLLKYWITTLVTYKYFIFRNMVKIYEVIFGLFADGDYCISNFACLHKVTCRVV